MKPGPKLEVVARNDLGNAGDEIFRASLTPVNGKLFVRSNQTLYCISAERSAGR
jgi:hypothetical protein